jgi:hypothetical protein
VGEPWTTLADGDPSYDLARRVALLGAEIVAPAATDWLRYRLWDQRRLDREPSEVPTSADATIASTWDRLAAAAGLAAPRPDMDRLAETAKPDYDPDIRGGSAHLEVGRALAAAHDRTAHLVLSLKPFGCLPSSSLSDGILAVLLREGRGPRFLALETTGDSDATAESRVEMALHAATLAAADELDAACAEARIARHDAARLLESLGDAEPPPGPRRYACTAAELVRLHTSRKAPGPALESAH